MEVGSVHDVHRWNRAAIVSGWSQEPCEEKATEDSIAHCVQLTSRRTITRGPGSDVE